MAQSDRQADRRASYNTFKVCIVSCRILWDCDGWALDPRGDQREWEKIFLHFKVKFIREQDSAARGQIKKRDAMQPSTETERTQVYPRVCVCVFESRALGVKLKREVRKILHYRRLHAWFFILIQTKCFQNDGTFYNMRISQTRLYAF